MSVFICLSGLSLKKTLEVENALTMNLSRRKSFCSGKTIAFCGFLCAVLTTALQLGEIEQTRMDAANRPLEGSLENNVVLKQQLTTLKNIPTLGFRNVLADSVFLNFLQYFSDISEQSNIDIDQNLSPAFFDTIISLDPFYRNYYLFLSSSTTLYAAQPQRTVELMAKGLAEMNPDIMPNSFYVWRYKGVDELLFLGDSQSAQDSFEKAADWASRSDAPESELVEKASRQTADFLAADPESRYAQIAAWRSVLSNAVNEAIRDQAVERIQQLGGSIDMLEDANEQTGSIQTDNSAQTEIDRG